MSRRNRKELRRLERQVIAARKMWDNAELILACAIKYSSPADVDRARLYYLHCKQQLEDFRKETP